MDLLKESQGASGVYLTHFENHCSIAYWFQNQTALCSKPSSTTCQLVTLSKLTYLSRSPLSREVEK